MIGIRTYQLGKKDRDLDKGSWIFRVNKDGIFLFTTSGFTRHLTLNEVTAIEKVAIDDSGYIYVLAHE